MSKSKYTYQSYDYSFLETRERCIFTTAKRVLAKTIGFELSEIKPLDEPVGQLYWMDYPFETTVTSTTYEPIREGGWEVKFTDPQVATTEAPLTDAAVTYTPREEKQVELPYYHVRSLYPHYTDIERVRKEKNKAYWSNVKTKYRNNFLKNIRIQKR